MTTSAEAIEAIRKISSDVDRGKVTYNQDEKGIAVGLGIRPSQVYNAVQSGQLKYDYVDGEIRNLRFNGQQIGDLKQISQLVAQYHGAEPASIRETKVTPTATEMIKNMSLRPELRNLPVNQLPSQQERLRQMSLAKQINARDFVQANKIQAQQLAVVPTPSLKERYSQYIKDKNPVTATLSFGLQEARSPLIRLERKYTPSSQSLFGGETGARVQDLATIGLYSNPLTGPALVVASSIGQFTPSGQREIRQFSEGVNKQTGLPIPVSQTGLNILGVGVGVIGARGAVSQASRALGYPKYSTQFLARQVAQEETTQGTKVISNILAQTKVKNLGNQKTFLSVAKSETQVNGQQFVSKTGGISKEILYDITTGKRSFGKPSYYADISAGITKPTEFSILVGKISNAEVRKSVEGNIIQALSKTAVNKAENSRYSVTAGGIFDINEGKALSLTKTIQITEKGKALRSGQGISLGLLEKAPKEIQSFSYGLGTIKKTSSPRQVNELFNKNAIENALKIQAVAKQTKNINVAKFTAPTFPIVSAMEEQFSKSIYYGKGQYEKTESVSSFLNPQMSLIRDRIMLVTTPRLADQAKERTQQKITLVQPSALKTKQMLNLFNPAAERTNQITSEIIKTKEILRPKLQGIQLNKVSPLGKPYQRPKPILSLLPRTTRVGGLVKSALSKLTKAYNVFTFRRGKKVILERNKPLNKATEIGSRYVKSTLGASLGLEESGYTAEPDISFQLDKGVFQPSKRFRNVLVQKRGARLSSLGERSEIKLFKRQKSRGRKFKLI